MHLIKRFLSDRAGATAIEYGLIGTVITGALLLGFNQLTAAVLGVFERVALFFTT